MDKIINSFNRAYALTDYNIHKNLDERYKFRLETIRKDNNLSGNEIEETIRLLQRRHDHDKIISGEGTKRKCENCKQECLATLYCELCVRDYLKKKFSEWSSGNDDIDKLIQKCQMETIGPSKIIEFIPPEKLKDVEYLTQGGQAEIYSAVWTDGHYNEWDSEKGELRRSGKEKVILKNLVNIERANRTWFEEAKSHLTISNKWASVVKCYGITYCPYTKNYVLVMYHMGMDLRQYLQLRNNKLEWKERIKIAVDIIDALLRIHKEDAVHRDLHSKNILHSEYDNNWYISDLGFCGPVNKPLGSIYGSIPFIAPEVIAGKEYTKASDIYSVGILMWEISSGKFPFGYDEYDYDLAMRIIDGIRPEVISGTPQEYVNLMEQCWDADPSKRPDTNKLWNRIMKIYRSFLQNDDDSQQYQQQIDSNDSNDSNTNNTNKLNLNPTNLKSTSKVYSISGLLREPRNATREEQKAYHSGNIYNNPNLHPEDQNELEISEDDFDPHIT